MGKRVKIATYTDEEIRDQAKSVFESLGLSLSAGIDVYLRTVVREKKIPFLVTTGNSNDERTD